MGSEIALLAVSLPALGGTRRTRPVDAIGRNVQSYLSLRSGGFTSDGSDREARPSRSSGETDGGAKVDAGHTVIPQDLESQPGAARHQEVQEHL